jgi:hypothetical protein
MKRLKRLTFLLCGILLTFAAFPVFAQKETAEEIKINKRPLQDLGDMLKEKLGKGEVDLSQPFKVSVEGVLTKDGKFDASLDKEGGKPKTQFVIVEGDEQMVDVAKSAIEAVGESGWFGYLRSFGAEKIKITVAQNQTDFSALIEMEQATDERAKSMASALRLLLSSTKMVGKFGEDEKIIIGGFAAPRDSGKVVILNFALPKQIMQDMIQRNLKKTAQAETWKAGE